MANKKTKKDYFNELINIINELELENKNELLGFIDHEVELLEKKASAKTQTKTQKENMGIKDIVVEVISANGNPMSITDMLKDERLSMYSNQKISALCKQLVDNGVLVRVEDKKKTLFQIA